MEKTGVTILALLLTWHSYQVCRLMPQPEIEVKTLNRGPNGAFFVFAPEVVRIEPGDSINFVAADKGHEVHSVPGMLPGALSPSKADEPGRQGDLTVSGVYVIACKPHTPMGMVAVIVVGEPVNLDKIDPSTLTGKARQARGSPCSLK
jgi:pseudoazurin